MGFNYGAVYVLLVTHLELALLSAHASYQGMLKFLELTRIAVSLFWASECSLVLVDLKSPVILVTEISTDLHHHDTVKI